MRDEIASAELHRLRLKLHIGQLVNMFSYKQDLLGSQTNGIYMIKAHINTQWLLTMFLWIQTAYQNILCWRNLLMMMTPIHNT